MPCCKYIFPSGELGNVGDLIGAMQSAKGASATRADLHEQPMPSETMRHAA